MKGKTPFVSKNTIRGLPKKQGRARKGNLILRMRECGVSWEN